MITADNLKILVKEFEVAEYYGDNGWMGEVLAKIKKLIEEEGE